MPGQFQFAISEKGNLFKAPETYMNKIAFGQNIPKDVIDLDNTIENIQNLSDFKIRKLKKLPFAYLKGIDMLK